MVGAILYQHKFTCEYVEPIAVQETSSTLPGTMG